MMTQVSHRHRLDRSREQVIADFVDEPGLWLPRPVRHVGPSRWRVELRAGGAHHLAVMEIGPPLGDSRARHRKVVWWPVPDAAHLDEHSRLLPDFEGEIAVTDTSDGLTVEIAGNYTPPAGALGALLDRAVLHRVADRTIRSLTESIGQRLDSIVDFG